MSDLVEKIRVEVVFATAQQQRLVTVALAPPATVADAITSSALAGRFPAEDLDALQAGIWGHPVDRSHVLSNGDRVEIYRPLALDPREARRQLAQTGRTMGGGSTE